tara:strand:+ start:715 stop:1440 length:726 start_codon:yes stop_codon:yes gene_type:complete
MGNQTSKKEEIPVAKAVRVTLKSNETKKELMKKYKERNPEESVYNTLASNGSLDELKVVLADENLDQILNTLWSTGHGYTDRATPLMTAAKYGNLEVVKYLLSLSETNPAKIDNRGQNALHHAAFIWTFNIQKRPTIVELLVQRLGNNINIIDKEGFTPLDLAFNDGEVSEGYQYYDKNTIDEGEDTGAQIRMKIIFWIRRSGGLANKNKISRFNKKIGPGSEFEDDSHIPKFQRETDMKF